MVRFFRSSLLSAAPQASRTSGVSCSKYLIDICGSSLCALGASSKADYSKCAEQSMPNPLQDHGKRAQQEGSECGSVPTRTCRYPLNARPPLQCEKEQSVRHRRKVDPVRPEKPGHIVMFDFFSEGTPSWGVPT